MGDHVTDAQFRGENELVATSGNEVLIYDVRKVARAVHRFADHGAVLTTRLLHSMRRDGLRRGIVTLCIGGGQGIALALETL